MRPLNVQSLRFSFVLPVNWHMWAVHRHRADGRKMAIFNKAVFLEIFANAVSNIACQAPVFELPIFEQLQPHSYAHRGIVASPIATAFVRPAALGACTY